MGRCVCQECSVLCPLSLNAPDPLPNGALPVSLFLGKCPYYARPCWDIGLCVFVRCICCVVTRLPHFPTPGLIDAADMHLPHSCAEENYMDCLEVESGFTSTLEPAPWEDVLGHSNSVCRAVSGGGEAGEVWLSPRDARFLILKVGTQGAEPGIWADRCPSILLCCLLLLASGG